MAYMKITLDFRVKGGMKITEETGHFPPSNFGVLVWGGKAMCCPKEDLEECKARFLQEVLADLQRKRKSLQKSLEKNGDTQSRIRGLIHVQWP